MKTFRNRPFLASHFSPRKAKVAFGKLLRVMCRYVRHHPVLWIVGLVLPPVFSLAARLIYAHANKHVAARLADNTATHSAVLLILGAAFLGMVAAEALHRATRYICAKFVIITESAVRQDLYEKLLRSLWCDLVSMNSGDLFTRYNHDTATAVATISEDVFNVLYPLVMGIGYCAAIFLANRTLGAVAAFLVIVVVLLNTHYVHLYRDIEKEKRVSEEGFAMEIDSVLQGKMSIRMMSVEDRMAYALERASEAIARKERHTIRLDLKRALTMDWFTTLCTTMILPFACLMASLDMIDIPNAIFVAQLSGTLIAHTRSFGLSVTKFGSDLVSVRRLRDFLDLPGEDLGQMGRINATRTKEVLALDGVSLQYGDKRILDNVSMHVNEGEIVALVGASGSGKSSIAKAILGLVDYGGQIRLWGMDSRDCSLGGLRSSIAYVPEHNDLVDGTIMDNLVLGNPEEDAENINTAMEWAALGELMYDDEFKNRRVGERGCRLSGGQRQRIALARAFVKDAPIMLMDEPTASLDTLSEDLVLDKLREMSRSGKSILLVTHRESTLKIADRIMMIKDGTLRSDVPFVEAVESLKRDACPAT